MGERRVRESGVGRVVAGSVVAVVIGLGAASCGSSDAPVTAAGGSNGSATVPSPGSGEAADTVEVSIGLFSGREDPTVTLDRAQLDAALALIDGLPVVDSRPEDTSGLGEFWGYTVTPSGSSAPYLDASHAFVVVFAADGTETVHADPDGTVLAALNEVVVPELDDPGLVERIRATDASMLDG